MKRYLVAFISILSVSSGYSQSEHTITLNSSNNVATLLMPQVEYDSWKTNDGFNNTTTRENLFKDIYKNFKDDFDFVFLVLNETTTPSGWPAGQLISVSNSTTNIGMTPYNDALKYGSAGKLKAVMSLSKITQLKNGPSLHELMHTWGNFILPTTWVNANGSGPIISSINNYMPHWGFTGGSSKGQLGGFNQADLQLVNLDANKQYFVKEFGGNANSGNVVPYTEFELYLMGMIPLFDVKPFDTFKNITWYERASTTNWDVYFKGDKTTYTSTKIQTDFGLRTPDAASSQKDFKLLVVVLTPTPLTPTQTTTITNDSNWFSAKQDDGTAFYNFWEATGGRGTMETGKLDQSLSTALSVNNYDFTQNALIYPIPADKVLNIESTTDIKNIIITNIEGQQMQVNKTELAPNKTSLDVTNYSPGVYFVKIENTFGNETVRKIVIE